MKKFSDLETDDEFGRIAVDFEGTKQNSELVIVSKKICIE